MYDGTCKLFNAHILVGSISYRFLRCEEQRTSEKLREQEEVWGPKRALCRGPKHQTPNTKQTFSALGFQLDIRRQSAGRCGYSAAIRRQLSRDRRSLATPLVAARQVRVTRVTFRWKQRKTEARAQRLAHTGGCCARSQVIHGPTPRPELRRPPRTKSVRQTGVRHSVVFGQEESQRALVQGGD